MTNEEKQLLLIDLCARLTYSVVCQYNCVIPIGKRSLVKTNAKDKLKGIIPMPNGHIGFMVGIDKIDALEGDIKPYLRPLSSMTEEEREEFRTLISPEASCAYEDCLEWDAHIIGGGCLQISVGDFSKAVDWLNAHHFDYRGLIENSLAIVAPDNMYK